MITAGQCVAARAGGALIILPVPRLYQALDTEGEYVHFHPPHMGDSGSPITSDIINPASYSRNNHFYSPLCELKLSWPKRDSSANQNKAGPLGTAGSPAQCKHSKHRLNIEQVSSLPPATHRSLRWRWWWVMDINDSYYRKRFSYGHVSQVDEWFE